MQLYIVLNPVRFLCGSSSGIRAGFASPYLARYLATNQRPSASQAHYSQVWSKSVLLLEPVLSTWPKKCIYYLECGVMCGSPLSISTMEEEYLGRRIPRKKNTQVTPPTLLRSQVCIYLIYQFIKITKFSYRCTRYITCYIKTIRSSSHICNKIGPKCWR